jgi:hypothetical protein
MNDEQKRKEDLEAAKGWLAIAKKDNNAMAIQILENLFPELKESEDERIRKAIYNAIKYLETEHSWDFLDDNVGILDAYSWLEKQGEQKPAWSEEDEKMWVQIINEIEAIKSNSSTIFEKNIAQDKIDWLKSLKPNHWKPSDLQLEALESAYKQLPNIQHFLQSLYNDLKKL